MSATRNPQGQPREDSTPLHVCEIFDLAVELSLAMGFQNINELDGPCVIEIDKRWKFAINGKDKPVEVSIPDSMGIESLEPFHMAIFFNGWLAGLLTPAGGTMCAGEAANEDSFIAAVNSKLSELGSGIPV